MTKKIFKSNILVAVVVLIFGIACVMAILYQHFGKQINTELEKEATYLAYGVEQQGVDYLKNIKDKNARITYIAQDGTVLYDNDADVGTMVWIPATGEKYHSIPNCGRMNPDTARQVSKSEAEAMGYGPCSKCY